MPAEHDVVSRQDSGNVGLRDDMCGNGEIEGKDDSRDRGECNKSCNRIVDDGS